MPDLTLDLRYLRYAIAAAEQGSFRRAALFLDLPQSTISRRIQLLESRLGAPLFERTRSGIRITLAGDRFLREARIGADHLRRAVDEISSSRRGDHGELRIGLFTSLASGFLADLLAEFRLRFPSVLVSVEEDTSAANIGNVVKGSLDAVFLTGEPCVRGCQTRLLWQERIHLALPSHHPLADQDSISWEDIRDESFVVSAGGPGPEIEHHIVKRLAAVGFRPAIHIHKIGRENLMNIVAKGFGLTLTTESTLGTAFSGVVFRSIEGEDQLVPSSIVWSDNNENPSLRRLMDLSSHLASKQARKRPARP